MEKIVISVGNSKPEDDILILQGQFKDKTVQVSNALVVETDMPQAAAIFKAIAADGQNGNITSQTGKKEYACVECGAKVSKKNVMCRSCGKKAKREKGEAAGYGEEKAVSEPEVAG
jgi:hypothetical protein